MNARLTSPPTTITTQFSRYRARLPRARHQHRTPFLWPSSSPRGCHGDAHQLLDAEPLLGRLTPTTVATSSAPPLSSSAFAPTLKSSTLILAVTTITAYLPQLPPTKWSTSSLIGDRHVLEPVAIAPTSTAATATLNKCLVSPMSCMMSRFGCGFIFSQLVIFSM
ncbi:hypothetical protein BS78_01G259600 [Paspalum vaginatum]|nr:hypothetical protein BS78_01G259600 [Paspalum vaginatum]